MSCSDILNTVQRVKYEREKQGLWFLFPKGDEDKVTFEKRLEGGQEQITGDEDRNDNSSLMILSFESSKYFP